MTSTANELPVHFVEPDLYSVLLARPLPAYPGPEYVDEIASPSTSQRRQCYLGLTAAGRALELDDPLAGIESVMDGLRGGKRRSDRDKAVMYATTLLLFLPRGTRPATADVARARGEVTAFDASIQLDDHPRFGVTLPSGRRTFLEVHPATHPGGHADDWMSRRIGAHLALGHHIPQFAGVVVLTARSPHLSVHVTDAGTHPRGDCPACKEVHR